MRARCRGSSPAGAGDGAHDLAVAREPIRTCIGCGERATQRGLVRLRVEGGDVVVDVDRSGGRGAWLHPAAACLERATRRKAFARALRAPSVRADPRVLRDLLTGNTRKD